MSVPSDESLMLAIARGDLDAFEQLVVQHQESVWRTAYGFVADRQGAEDIAQEAFLRVFEAAPRYRPTAAFRTYLYRIVTRLCRDRHRKASPSLHACPDAEASQGPSPEASALAREERRAVQEALASLPTRQREAVVLRYYEHLSYDEIGEVTGNSRKGVERLLARGRVTLGNLLSGLMGE